MLDTMTHLIAAVNPVETIVTQLRAVLIPVYLLVVAGVSAGFLIRRQLRPFFQFMILAVLVGIFIFNPEAIRSIAEWASTLAGGSAPA